MMRAIEYRRVNGGMRGVCILTPLFCRRYSARVRICHALGRRLKTVLDGFICRLHFSNKMIYKYIISQLYDLLIDQKVMMAKVVNRVYSGYTREAIALLSVLIREARIERKLSAQELADRAGISRGLLQRIEKGDPNCSLGAVFEVAYLLGIRLFDHDKPALTARVALGKEKLSLLPKMARKASRRVDDDF